jgi:hypothetical protein
MESNFKRKKWLVINTVSSEKIKLLEKKKSHPWLNLSILIHKEV